MAASKYFVICVEGDDDERFVKSVLQPRIAGTTDPLLCFKYAEERIEKVNLFLETVAALGWSYILLCDLDDCPDRDIRCEQVRATFRPLEHEQIVVVEREIESWYLSGLNDIDASELDVQPIRRTDRIGKTALERAAHGCGRPLVDFKVELLRRFDVQTARLRNTSFDEFIEKLLR
jgi:hypothetical protein